MPRVLHHFLMGHLQDEGVVEIPQNEIDRALEQGAWIWRKIREEIADSPGKVQKVYFEAMDEENHPQEVEQLKADMASGITIDQIDRPVGRALFHLILNGADLRLTENSALLRRSIQTWEDLGESQVSEDDPRFAPIKEAIDDRDRFIAETIDKDLEDGEVGVLILGADHGQVVWEMLSSRMEYVIHQGILDPFWLDDVEE